MMQKVTSYSRFTQSQAVRGGCWSRLVKRVFVLSTVFCATASFVGLPTEQPLPVEKPLQELAGDRILIASLIEPGMYHPIDDVAEFKVAYREAALRELGGGTVPIYPFGTWKEPDFADFTRFNDLTNWLKANDKKVIAHLLVGPNHYYLDWFRKGEFTVEELEEMLEFYIKTAITSNGNDTKADIWNVVNEALHGDKHDDAEHYYRYSHWNALGYEPDRSGLSGDAAPIKEHPVWVRKAFEIARKYTDATLEYRDNNCEFPDNRHYDAFYQVLAHLVNSGAPLDAAGFQTHMNIGTDYDWEGHRRQIERIQALGLDVYNTEVDFNKSDNSPEHRERQRQQAYNITRVSVESGVKMLNFWGLRDREVPNKPEQNFARLFEDFSSNRGEPFDPKPAYFGIRQALIDTLPTNEEE
ncbi:MAG: endo-1,4-beta-xylanase [Bacteroidota bacterium]